MTPWDSLGQNTGVGSFSLLHRIFPSQGSIPGLPHCRQMLYPLCYHMAKQPLYQRSWNSILWEKFRERIISRCTGPLMPIHPRAAHRNLTRLEVRFWDWLQKHQPLAKCNDKPEFNSNMTYQNIAPNCILSIPHEGLEEAPRSLLLGSSIGI